MLKLQIIDNGVGFVEENQFGNGLKNMQKRMNITWQPAYSFKPGHTSRSYLTLEQGSLGLPCHHNSNRCGNFNKKNDGKEYPGI